MRRGPVAHRIGFPGEDGGRTIRIPLPRTLPGRLVLLLMAAGAIVFAVVAAVETQLHGRRVHEEVLVREGILAHHTIRAMLVAMGARRPSGIDEVLETLASAPGVRHIRVLGMDGTIRHSSEAGEIGRRALDFPARKVVEDGVWLELTEAGDRTFARVYEPVRNEPQCRRCHGSQAVNGILELKLDTTSSSRGLERDRWMVLGLLVGGQALLFVLVFFLFRWLLIQPVRALIRSMQRVAEGELDAPVHIESPRELAEVGRQFNEMVERLRRAQEERDRWYRESMARAAQMVTVGELATAMAHEIRNPLTGISGALQVLAKDPALEARRPIVKRILETVERLSKTVSDLLSFGRPTRPSRRDCDVRDIVEGALTLIRRPASRSHSVEVTEDVAPGLPLVHADPGQVQQVLLNVLLNAVQAASGGGRVAVVGRERTDPDGARWVRLSVLDTGPGVPDDQLERIFAPFYTTKPKGTGLGLAICRRMAEDNGGRIFAENRPEGGLAVHLDLPIAGAAAEAAEDGERSASTA